VFHVRVNNDETNNECVYLDLNTNIHASPMHTLKTNLLSYDEELELERNITYLERRLATAKTQLIHGNCQKKNKPLKLVE
jgi:hypothetical protein